MFSHVMIGTNDLEKAKSFYDALLGTLGVPPGRVDRHRIFYRTKTGTFSVSKPIDGKPATPANGGTVGFAADSAEAADAWHAAGIAMAGRPAKIRRACAKAAGSSSILPICAIPTATSSAPCTGWRDATWALASLEGRLALFLHRRSRLLGVFTFLDLVEHALGPAGLFGRSQRQNTFRDKTLQRFQHQR